MRTSTRLLILLTGINLLNYLDRYVVAAVLEPLGRDLHLTDVQLGRLPFVFVVVYMLSAPLFGWLADRYHRPKLVALGVALWSLATVGAAFVHSYPALLFTRSLVGVGEAAYATLGPAILADVVPEDERAAKFTWFYLAIPVGSAFGYGLGGLVAQHWGWRAAFMVAGLPGLIFAVRMMLLPDPVRGGMDQTKDLAADLTFGERLGAIFRNRVWLACTGSYVAYTFAMGALSHWGPTLLQRKFAVSTGQAGTVFGGIAVITGIVGTFLGGSLTSRLQKRFPDAGVWISGLTLLAAGPVVGLALGAGNLNLVYALFFAGMLLLFINTSPVNALTVSSLPASVRATGVAINVLLIHLLGDAISPEWVGHRSEALHGLGLGTGEALGRAMLIAVPAILLSGVALWWARKQEATA
ncbi:MAG TPA: MFS transporter [Holophagaceae bacterium]|nr:MFS transporter [Holophagaceae bacterium]